MSTDTPAQTRPLDDWHEDIGPVLWWRFPIEEAPYVGHPNCDDWTGYHTHWTPLVTPSAPGAASPQPTAAQPLTDEQINQGAEALGSGLNQVIGAYFRAGARFAEDAHGIGASAAPTQAAPGDGAVYSAASERASPEWHRGFKAGLASGGAAPVAELVETLRGLLNIVKDSHGVYGYHLNGDGAEWGEFEEVAAAEAALSRVPGAGMPNGPVNLTTRAANDL